MEIKYTRQGDYLIPNLYLEKDEECGRIGKYGISRLHFIAQNKQALYETLLMTNKLTHHLLLVSDSCESLWWKTVWKKQRIKSIRMDKVNE